jgi:hypothetical protein
MEKKFNYADLSQVSKKTVDKNKKIEAQGEQFLKEYYAKLSEEKTLLEKKKEAEILSNARFSQASPYMKNKAKTKLMEDTISYADRATTAVMTDILSTIVENSLLLDTEDYAKLNPSYKEEIKGTVKSFLESANIELDVSDKRTLTLMEYVAKSLPQVNTGVYLKEEEIIDMVKKSTPAEVMSAIDSLSGSVKDRVAGIVVREQDQAAEIEGDVQEVRDVAGIPSEEEAAAQDPGLPEEIVQALAQVGIEATPDGQFIDQEGNPVPPEAVEQILTQMQGEQEGEMPVEGQEGEMPVEGQEGEMPMSPEEEAMMAQQQGMAPGMEDPYADDEYLAYQQGTTTPGFSQGAVSGEQQIVPQTANKNTAVEVAPDGTVKINIVRERFYQEVPRQGILESLALNEAKDMIAEGKEYNGDLAIAKALVHLTILETFNQSGLITITEMDYKKMFNLPKTDIESSKYGGEPSNARIASATPATAQKTVHSAVDVESAKFGGEPSDARIKSSTPAKAGETIHHAEEVKAPLIESWKEKALKAIKK